VESGGFLTEEAGFFSPFFYGPFSADLPFPLGVGRCSPRVVRSAGESVFSQWSREEDGTVSSHLALYGPNRRMELKKEIPTDAIVIIRLDVLGLDFPRGQ